jgi:hypothetical protein
MEEMIVTLPENEDEEIRREIADMEEDLKQRTWRKIELIDCIVDVEPSRQEGGWEDEISGGYCSYNVETKTLHLGASMVYGAHHHYPCGNPEIDAEMKQEIEDRAVQWGEIWEEAEKFPWPIRRVYKCGQLVWEAE